MLNLITPQELPIESNPVLAKIRKPYKLPIALEKEEKEVYVWFVKEDAPFESETIAGETVTKYKLPADHSLITNRGKQKKQRIQTITLTKKQAKSLSERTKEHEKVCFCKKTKRHIVVNCSDWIELLTLDEYKNKMFSGGGEITP